MIYLQHRLQPGVDKCLIVVFSPINIPKGKFGFSRFFSKFKSNVLFFNCQNTWYVDCIEDMIEVIDQTMRSISPDQVIFYGASMGAYAAARIGGLYPNYPTYLFGPELELYIDGSLSSKHAKIRKDGVNILEHQGLDFSNTIALFGIYEPIDMLQYKQAKSLNFLARIPVRSPHAVHEELYYRGLIEPLAQSRTAEEFIQNIPLNFIDNHAPVEHAEFLYEQFFHTPEINNSEAFGKLMTINHPLAYWVGIRVSFREKKLQQLNLIQTRLSQFFPKNTEGFSMPEKFTKELKRVRERLGVSLEQ